MEQITITLYKFSELGKQQKRRAVSDWFSSKIVDYGKYKNDKEGMKDCLRYLEENDGDFHFLKTGSFFSFFPFAR